MVCVEICENISQAKQSLVKLHQKVNLVTLNIQDAEIQKEYQEARLKHYWTSIVVADLLREIIMVFSILAGFFDNRDMVPQYVIRLIYYLLLGLLYIVSKKRPQIKDFVVLILAIAYNLLFAYSIVHLLSYGTEQQFLSFQVIGPVVQFYQLVRITLLHSTNFWTCGLIVLPTYLLMYLFQMSQYEQIVELKSAQSQMPSQNPHLNFYFVLWPNFTLLVQTLFTVCYVSELNRVMIWFQAKEKGTITKFYEETVQDKIPVLLVSNGHQKVDKSTLSLQQLLNNTSQESNVEDNKVKKSFSIIKCMEDE